MLPPSFHRLFIVACGFRGTEQLLVAGSPLVVATVFAQDPDVVGLIVAIQSSAWLIASLPAGVMVDRSSPPDALFRGILCALAGVVLSMVGIVFDSLPLFAAGAFVGSCAAVIGFLAESASIQSLVTPIQFPRANGRLQIVQSMAMLIAPALMGLVTSWSAPLAGYAAAMVLAVAGFSAARGFGAQPHRAKRPRQPIREIGEGYRFVRSQPLLMGIVACASFWNAGFFALIAVFIPFALGPIGLTAAQAGLAQAMMGVGSLTAALIAGWLLTIVSPRCILFFGPASSLVAAVVLVVASGPGGMLIPSLVFLSLGFGPILWLVCQNSVRQLVTPPELLGRVGSVVQVAIYGVRAVGALASGVVAAQVGFDAAILLVIALFGASTLSVYFSALGTLTLMPPQFVEAGAK